MFYYLDGTVAEILPYLAVIDCGGVGYACKTTNNTLASLKKGQRGKLYTYLNVGEGIFELYGFATQNELNSFKLLISVSGVGPKAALAILSSGTPESLAMAIVTGDEKSLTGLSIRPWPSAPPGTACAMASARPCSNLTTIWMWSPGWRRAIPSTMPIPSG